MASPLLKRRVRLRPSAKTTLKKPTKKATTKKATTKKARSPARASTLKQRTDIAIAEIQSRLSTTEASYYDVGRALLSLRKPEIWALYAETTFKGFLNAQVMPYSTALRMVTVAEAYPKKIALDIGQERGFQLARLARLDPKLKKKEAKPVDLWNKNAKLGQRHVKTMNGAEIAALVQLAIMRSKQSQKRASASPQQREAYDELREDWRELLGHEAEFHLDLKKGVVRIEVKLSDLID